MLDVAILGSHTNFDLLHLLLEQLDGVEFLIGGGGGNFLKNLQNAFVLALQLEDLDGELAILICVLDHVLARFNLVEGANELVRKGINPLVEFPAHLHQLTSDGFLPFLDEGHGGSVLHHCAVGHRLDRLVLLHIVLVLFVHVDETFLAHHAQEAAPRIHLLGEKDCGAIVVCTVDRERAVRHLIVCIDQECIVNNLFGYVALHVLGLLSIVGQLINHLHHVGPATLVKVHRILLGRQIRRWDLGD